METDHLEEAIKFLRSALHQDADVGRVSRSNLEGAFYHVEKAREQMRHPPAEGDER